MPCSMMSATSSGGVSSIAVFTSSTIVLTGGEIASRSSTELISTDFGKPVKVVQYPAGSYDGDYRCGR